MAKIINQSFEYEASLTSLITMGQGIQIEQPVHFAPEELDGLTISNLLVLLSPIWWWRALLEVPDYAIADSVKLSETVAAATGGFFEVKYLEVRRWLLVKKTEEGVRANFVRLTKDGHLVNESTGKVLLVTNYETLRREAIIGFLKIVAVREDRDEAESRATVNSRKANIRRGHFRNMAICGRASHQVPPKHLGLPDRRTQGYTWVHQMELATAS